MYLFGRSTLVAVSFLLLFLTVLISTPGHSFAQPVARKVVDSIATNKAGDTAVSAPSKSSHWAYRNVTLGMQTDEARKALGNPKDKADDQDLYMFSDEELVQIYYDGKKLVTAISITYYKDLSKAPSAKEVLGEDAPPKPDGTIFKTVRFAKAGYSASYSKTAGDSASVSITLQKL